jgi:hypothetical protein
MYVNLCKIIDFKLKHKFTICFCKYVKNVEDHFLFHQKSQHKKYFSKQYFIETLKKDYATSMAVAYEHSVCTTGMTNGQIQQIRNDEYNRLKPLVDEMVNEYLQTNPINIKLD